jgi:phage tail tube protein FII
MTIIQRFSTKKKYKVTYINEINNKSAEFEVDGLANIYEQNF